MKHVLLDKHAFETNCARVSGTDYHHLIRVMRLSEGDAVSASDGHGARYTGILSAVDKRSATISFDQPPTHVPRPKPSLSLVYGVARGQRSEWILQKATEIGVDHFFPAVCERSMAKPQESKQTRLAEIVRQAARQSERAWLPTVAPPLPLAQQLEQLPTAPSQLRIIADVPGKAIAEQAWVACEDVVMLVGPEGGFSQTEHTLAEERGFVTVSLGPTVLRCETAAIALATLAAHLGGRWESAQ